MPGQRRSYPKSFKAQVVDECIQPGASVAGVALSHGLNANLVHKWIRCQQAQLPAAPSSFIPIPLVPNLPATPNAADMAIQIAIPHGDFVCSVAKAPLAFPDHSGGALTC
ncbi:IS66-like element accessory protein TnpA [Pseudomonas citronellolis]|uniref:IS66-like element accessory protein TnpA n=1 Tax=Pseudomonas citronellolis TaxID=53408 RepID=UPI003899C281